VRNVECAVPVGDTRLARLASLESDGECFFAFYPPLKWRAIIMSSRRDQECFLGWVSTNMPRLRRWGTAGGTKKGIKNLRFEISEGTSDVEPQPLRG